MKPMHQQTMPRKHKNKLTGSVHGCALALVLVLTAVAGFGQSESVKSVANSLALFKEKKDIKYLGAAQASVDSLLKASPDTVNLEHNVYRAMTYASILYADSANKLKEPASLLPQTAALIDRIEKNRFADRYDQQLDYSKRCVANVYLRKAFVFVNSSDFINAMPLLQSAEHFAPGFRPLKAYIAYSNNKLGNLHAAAKYYESMVGGDSTKAEYAETASSIYKTFGDTVSALNIITKARKVLPNDRSLLLDEANIYANQRNYRALENLLPALLDINANNADIAFVAANCYDHLNQFDKAESLYQRSIELNSTAYDPIFNLGLLYFRHSQSGWDQDKRQDEAKATQWLEKANEINPNDVNCLQVLKLVYAQLGERNQVDKVTGKIKQLTNQ